MDVARGHGLPHPALECVSTEAQYFSFCHFKGSRVPDHPYYSKLESNLEGELP